MSSCNGKKGHSPEKQCFRPYSFCCNYPTLLSTNALFHFIIKLLTYQLLTCHYICLYICAGSPDVTSLTFDVRSTTLTCASTGGPATTVTWRRDGVVITLNATHQQTKRLVDPVNGTYQTVLTIDPSVGWSDIMGTYNCTVKNVRGESSETVVVPGEMWPLFTFYATFANMPLCYRNSCSVFFIPKKKRAQYKVWLSILDKF